MTDNKHLGLFLNGEVARVELLLEEGRNLIDVLYIEECIHLVHHKNRWLDYLGHGEDKCKRGHGPLSSREILQIHTISLTWWTEVKNDICIERLIHSIGDKQAGCAGSLGQLSVVGRQLIADLVEEGQELFLSLH